MINLVSDWMSPRNGRGRIALLAVVAGLGGAVAGMIAAATSGPFDPPFGSGGQAADPRPDAPMTVVQEADPAMRFPAQLQSLLGLSYDLVVDSAGDLWWVQFGGMAPEGSAPGQYDPYTDQAGKTVESALVRYDPDTGLTAKYAIPGSVGTPLMSSLAIDARGHIVWAEGYLVVDFDPATATYRSYTLGDTQFAHAFTTNDGQWISDTAVAGATAYVSRMNVAAITAIDLESGQVREIPYPASFGPVYGLSAGLGFLWLANPYSNTDGSYVAGTARLDPATGGFTLEKDQPTAYAATRDGSRMFTVVPSAGVLQRKKGTGSFEPFSSSLTERIRATGHEPWTDFGGDKLAVDPSGEAVWVASNQIDQILRVSRTGEVAAFNLPVTRSSTFPCGGLPETVCNAPEVQELHFAVRGLAVAPDGDLYFSDGYRIGVITPPK